MVGWACGGAVKALRFIATVLGVAVKNAWRRIRGLPPIGDA